MDTVSQTMKPQAILVGFSYTLYAVHITSVPLWLWACFRELHLQSQMAHSAEGKRPTAWEYFAARFFLVYAIADAVRNADMAVENDDAVYRSVWGIGTMGLRLAAWWIRDAACFSGVAVWLHFTVGWTHEALGHTLPRGLIFGLLTACLVVVLGLAICFYWVLATNRQAWIVASALTIVPLNVVMAVVNVRLLWSVFPTLQRLAKEASNTQAATIVFQSWSSAWVMLFFNISFLTIFPVICADKIRRGAYNQSVVMDFPFDTWVGGASLPTLAGLPEGVSTIPIPEVLELMLGWLNLITCVLASRGYATSSTPRTASPYIDYTTLGTDLRFLFRNFEHSKSD